MATRGPGDPAEHDVPRVPRATSTERDARDASVVPKVADITQSPWPPAGGEPRVLALARACGTNDGALVRVAERLAEDRARGRGLADPDRVVGLLRENGEPHVRPRVLSASDHGLDDEALRRQLEAARRPTTRCGVAIARTAQGKEYFVGVTVEALADLEPLPMRARTGSWLTWSATLRVPAENAKLVVLGARGLPRTVPTSTGPNRSVRARFALDRPGPFTVQLVAETDAGPQPLLEARVFADVEPDAFDAVPAPGEEVDAGDDIAALERMTAALRASESLPPLTRDPRLDALAGAHAEKMRRSGAIAHDHGDGDLQTRFEAEGYAARSVGENVARSRSLPLAHRALHASPSHRMNLLRSDYTHLGLGVARDDAGNVYVCEVFAAGMR